MKTGIGTFYVVDFDRCIGNIDASFDILKEVVHDLGIIDRQIFKSMRDEVESNGITFSALEQIVARYPSVNLDEIEKLYYQRAKLKPGSLLEPGAIDFINFLTDTKQYFCIMTFGDKRWQTIKITGSGIDDVPLVIVKNPRKSEYIQKWLNPKTGQFQLPGRLFKDGIAKISTEVVLIDDKISAFTNLPIGLRGYYISGSSSKYIDKQLDKLPASVR